jgi:hypothetical protein
VRPVLRGMCFALLATLLVLATASPASAARHRTLSSSVVTTASPYTPWPTDPTSCGPGNLPCAKEFVAEIRSGPLGVAGAAYMDCDEVGVKTLRRDGWVTSVLRNWADWTAKPVGAVHLCVTRFNTADDAVKAYWQVRGNMKPFGGGVSPISLPGIDHVMGYSQNYGDNVLQFDFVVFQTGVFVTTAQASVTLKVVGSEQPGDAGDAAAVVKRLARSQYSELLGLR